MRRSNGVFAGLLQSLPARACGLALLLCPHADARVACADAGPCCAGDLSLNGVVDAVDLRLMLGAWGVPASGIPEDLDASGVVDGGDLAILLGNWGSCPARCLSTVLSGNVIFEDGSPVSQAVVLTQAGGLGVTNVDGSFEFTVQLDDSISSLQVTAAVSIAGTTFVGTKLVEPVIVGGATDAGVITVLGDAACDPTWLPTFGGQPGVTGPIYSMAAYDDGRGGGAALYVAGFFSVAGGVNCNNIARWDGASWHALDSGLNDEARTLVVFDAGSGADPILVVGGKFTTAGGVPANRIAQWDGDSWSPVGSGMNGTVLGLKYINASSEAPASQVDAGLYAVGAFTTAGGASARAIARWNGTSWTGVGSGIIGAANSLVAIDDGGGGTAAIVVGGTFSQAGTVQANNIAQWNGSSWATLGSGLNGGVTSMILHHDGDSEAPQIVVGGLFSQAGGASAHRIAMWDGKGWSPLGSGLDGVVMSLASRQESCEGGPTLYAGGAFFIGGGSPLKNIAKWDGTSWSPLGTGVDNPVSSLLVFDREDGAADDLYAGGSFLNAGDTPATRIARWSCDDGGESSWSPVGDGLDSWVDAVAVFDDGSGAGPVLYAGGSFRYAGGVELNGIARWTTRGWAPLGEGVAGPNGALGVVNALAVYDDGRGEALYVGGGFAFAGGLPASSIAAWDGDSWEAVSSGVSGGVFALVSHDDGRGDGKKLYAAGTFSAAGGAPAFRIASWDGTSWAPLGAGLSGGAVRALASYRDSRGRSLLAVGGEFDTAGGVSAKAIASWDGMSWSALASGFNGTVYAITEFDDGLGGGPMLYAGGAFTAAGGVPANRVARWNGTAWLPVGSGLNDSVSSFATIDEVGDRGRVLIVGGKFTTAGGVAASSVATWDGATWSGLGSGMDKTVEALIAVDGIIGVGPELIAAGNFGQSAGGDSFIARLGCPSPPISPSTVERRHSSRVRPATSFPQQSR